jgi:hypothetical protein
MAYSRDCDKERMVSDGRTAPVIKEDKDFRPPREVPGRSSGFIL